MVSPTRSNRRLLIGADRSRQQWRAHDARFLYLTNFHIVRSSIVISIRIGKEPLTALCSFQTGFVLQEHEVTILFVDVTGWHRKAIGLGTPTDLDLGVTPPSILLLRDERYAVGTWCRLCVSYKYSLAHVRARL